MAKTSQHLDTLIEQLKEESRQIEIEEKKASSDDDTPEESQNIVDIITFCEHPIYLNLPNQHIHLRIAQRIILKCFYMGSRGNENMKLDEVEKEWLKEKKLNYVLDKIIPIENGEKPEHKLFDHLILVIGRRSGKTFLCSIIAAYESFKLLELPGGCPQEYYNLPQDNEIVILNVARSTKQAKVLFNEIISRIRRAPYFKDKLDAASTKGDEIHLFTDRDKETNEDPENPIDLAGTIILICGHSSSESLRGRGSITIMFDELAFMLNTTGGQSGYEIYKALAPSTKTFMANGDATRPDGRIIAISSPSGPDGMFYDLYKDSELDEKSLMFQVPTWDANPSITRDSLAADERRDPDAFMMEFGAQFAHTGSNVFLPPEMVEEAQSETMLCRQEKGEQGRVYYMHVDPAVSSHVYAVVLGYCQEYQNEYQERRKRVYITHSQRWTPKDGQEVNIREVEKYIIQVCRRFNVAAITFDQWNSAQTIQNLKRYGLPLHKTPFRKQFKMQIYGAMKELVLRGDLEFYSDYYILNELKGLRIKYVENGWKIFPNLKSEVPTDDTSDCIAAICHFSTSGEFLVNTRFPRSGIASNIYGANSMAQLHQQFDRRFS